MRNRVAPLLMILTVACGTPLAGDDSDIEVVRSSAVFAPAQDPAALGDLVAGDTAFSLDLLRVAFDGGNLITSPFSIATALGMLEPGARGQTRTEIAAVLHETLPEDLLHPARGALLAALAEGQPASDDDPPPFNLRAVNTVWAQRDYPILPAYLDILSASYDAGISVLDFMSDPEAARVRINEAVAGQTEQRIEDLIPEGVITALTRMVLTNAVYFKANWLNEFSPESTTDGPFTTAAGIEVTVPMMSSSMRTGYFDGDGYTAAWLPYVGDASMMVLLPDDDIAGLLDRLTQAEIGDARARQGSYQVDLTMPRFEFRSELTLATLLKDLGMRAAFVAPPGADSADLTGIVDQRELYVQDVIHQGFVAVDEKGTEAAAATAIVVGATSMPEPATLVLNRPFLFLIQHTPTGEILFAGVVADPSI